MAHYSQEKFVSICSKYIKSNIKNFYNLDTLDVGSLDLCQTNNRKYFGNKYLGIDLAEGPNVDKILNGADIHLLNKKFNIILSCEVFEHAENWSNIFKSMIMNSDEKGIVLFTCASTGRIEHGTLRTNPGESPGTNSNYYKNLTKKDFINKFDLDKYFEKYFFFYNYYSLDLFFIGIKNLKYVSFDFEAFRQEVTNIKSDIKVIFYKRLFYSHIMSDKFYQNFRFLRRKIINFRNLRQKIVNFLSFRK